MKGRATSLSDLQLEEGSKTKTISSSDVELYKVNQGNMGVTYKVDLGRNGPSFFVKHTIPLNERIGVAQLLKDHTNQKKEEFVNSVYEKEFLTLSLLNLLGLKTPTEMALLKYNGGSIMIKRDIGDFEERGRLPIYAAPNAGYETRFDTLMDIFKLGDVTNNPGNTIPVYDRSGKWNRERRLAVIDNLLTVGEITDYWGSRVETLTRYGGERDTKDLRKIVYHYNANKEEIDGLTRRLDKEYKDLVNLIYDYRRKYPGAGGASKEIERKHQILADTKGDFHPSKKLEKAVGLISRKMSEFNIDEYQPKPEGAYLARNVDPALNEETITFILKVLSDHRNISDINVRGKDFRFETYSAKHHQTCQGAFSVDFNPMPEVEVPDKAKITAKKVSEKTSSCTIS